MRQPNHHFQTDGQTEVHRYSQGTPYVVTKSTTTAGEGPAGQEKSGLRAKRRRLKASPVEIHGRLGVKARNLGANLAAWSTEQKHGARNKAAWEHGTINDGPHWSSVMACTRE